MPKISRAEEKMRMERIRLHLARGSTNDDICTELEIHPRTLRRYKKQIREELIGELDGKQVLDLWVAHKKRMDEVITECYRKLNRGADADTSPDKLYKTIQSASESIIDMGIKIGIVPQVAQKLSVDMEVKKDDDTLRALLNTHKSEINSSIPEEPTP